MSAVSSESHDPASEPGQRGQAAAPEPAPVQADFGANEWLVEELYQRYLADPGSVDRAWWSFFADYQPTLPNGTAPQSPQPVIGRQSAAPAAPAPAPARPPAPSSPPAAPAPPAQQYLLPRAQQYLLPRAQLCLLPRAQLCLLPRAHPKVPRSAGCAARRRAPSPT